MELEILRKQSQRLLKEGRILYQNKKISRKQLASLQSVARIAQTLSDSLLVDADAPVLKATRKYNAAVKLYEKNAEGQENLITFDAVDALLIKATAAQKPMAKRLGIPLIEVQNLLDKVIAAQETIADKKADKHYTLYVDKEALQLQSIGNRQTDLNNEIKDAPARIPPNHPLYKEYSDKVHYLVSAKLARQHRKNLKLIAPKKLIVNRRTSIDKLKAKINALLPNKQEYNALSDSGRQLVDAVIKAQKTIFAKNDYSKIKALLRKVTKYQANNWEKPVKSTFKKWILRKLNSIRQAFVAIGQQISQLFSSSAKPVKLNTQRKEPQNPKKVEGILKQQKTGAKKPRSNTEKSSRKKRRVTFQEKAVTVRVDYYPQQGNKKSPITPSDYTVPVTNLDYHTPVREHLNEQGAKNPQKRSTLPRFGQVR